MRQRGQPVIWRSWKRSLWVIYTEDAEGPVRSELYISFCFRVERGPGGWGSGGGCQGVAFSSRGRGLEWPIWEFKGGENYELEEQWRTL